VSFLRRTIYERSCIKFISMTIHCMYTNMSWRFLSVKEISPHFVDCAKKPVNLKVADLSDSGERQTLIVTTNVTTY